MKNKNTIGIFVLAFNRLGHLKKVINALSKYTKSNEVIYIFADNSNIKSILTNLEIISYEFLTLIGNRIIRRYN